MIRALVVTVSMIATDAHSAEFFFCWTGSNDYTMVGRMEIPDPALSKPIITTEDVTRFKIAGYHEGTLLGTWNMNERTEGTTWRLHFDPTTRSFLGGAALPSGYSQGWNADGTATDCGNPGFGFNSGNYAQDFCLNGVWVEESGIDPATIFLVSDRPVDPFCRISAPVS